MVEKKHDHEILIIICILLSFHVMVKKNHCLKISYIQVLKWLDGYMSSRTLHLESTWYIRTKQLTGGVISPTIIHPLNLWFVSRAIEFFMAMSHSGLEMRSFLNPFSNWHTSAVVAIMLSLVSVDELPVPSNKRIHNPADLEFYVLCFVETGNDPHGMQRIEGVLALCPCQMLSNPGRPSMFESAKWSVIEGIDNYELYLQGSSIG